MVGSTKSPNWQYIPLIYHLYIAFWGVICYLPPIKGTRNNHWHWKRKIIFQTCILGFHLSFFQGVNKRKSSQILRVSCSVFITWKNLDECCESHSIQESEYGRCEILYDLSKKNKNIWELSYLISEIPERRKYWHSKFKASYPLGNPSPGPSLPKSNIADIAPKNRPSRKESSRGYVSLHWTQVDQ